MADDISEEVEISAADLGLGGENEVVEEEVVESEEVVSDDDVRADTNTSESQETQEERKPVPQSWRKEYEEYWDSLDPKVQEIFERREKQMSDGLEQYKEHSSLGRQIKDVVAPYEQFLQQQGVDAPRALQYLLNAHYKLTNSSPEEKKSYLNFLAKSYNVNLEQDENTDPVIKSLQDQLAGIQQNLSHKEMAQQEQQRLAAVKEVETFAADKPYFDDVADYIVPFIQSGQSLADAYERAVWANPVTRQKELARIQTESEKTLQEKAKAESLKAKQSIGANVRGRDTRRTPTETKGTMEDTMRETLKDIRSRPH